MPQGQVPAVLDFDHLDRVTFGDAALANEVLQLFAQQLPVLIEDIAANADRADGAAHTLRGSARAVGAAFLDAALTEYEQAVRTGAGLDEAIRELRQCAAAIDVALRAYLAKQLPEAPRAGVGKIEPL